MEKRIEYWKPVEGWPNYEVSDLGRVKNLCPRKSGSTGILKPVALKKLGYLKVTLCNAGLRKDLLIHRLVAIAFIRTEIAGVEVNHKNSDRADNRLSNLEWVTKSENSRHGCVFGMKFPPSYTRSKAPTMKDYSEYRKREQDRWQNETTTHSMI